MRVDKSKSPIQQATPFQRFTIRLVDGKFVRVPKSDLPSTEPQTDQSATSNQTEIRDLCRLVNGHFVVTRPGPADAASPASGAQMPPGAAPYLDPTFDLPE